MKTKAFTLIELLIVVAIIAILAAIAVPNFLEAQVRSKISRAQADMRSIATALEAYSVDNNRYPLGYMSIRQAGVAGKASLNMPPLDRLSFAHAQLTTPVAYITTAFKDPFTFGTFFFDRTQVGGLSQGLEFWYDDYQQWPFLDSSQNNYAYSRFGRLNERGYTWSLSSAGPSLKTQQMWYALDEDITLANSNDQVIHPYDATNGTVSDGFVGRTNKGIFTETYDRN